MAKACNNYLDISRIWVLTLKKKNHKLILLKVGQCAVIKKKKIPKNNNNKMERKVEFDKKIDSSDRNKIKFPSFSRTVL